ncbi:tubulin-like doman-containing protein [Larkinella arboricola]|nr:tubulin-like doman-containing protein [Larkinella arboricola]
MANHILIGLGGTGGKIIRAFRKTIYQEFRQTKPENAHLGYLYVDSSDELMSLEDSTWKILGKSVQLGENSKVRIKGQNLKPILNSVDQYPGIQPWIGDRAVWNDILGSIVGDAAGSQRRRLGRFLLATNVTSFINALNAQVQELVKNSQEPNVTFHVCCGLAGGTGSGTAVDVVTQIRNNYRPTYPGQYRIVIYAFLPDEKPKPNRDMTGFYHANGYAALKELNALSIGTFKPVDLAAKNPNQLRLELQDPFNGCYLFSNQNENGYLVDVDARLPDIIADFLYQKIIALETVQVIGGQEEHPQVTLSRQENAENGDSGPEPSPNDANVMERSKRFLTFGLKRIAIPEEEIREYTTLTLANQATQHLLYNNWNDDTGWDNKPKNIDYTSYVQKKENLEAWFLSNDHITYSKGILEGDRTNKNWKLISEYWQVVAGPMMDTAMQEDWSQWLREIERLFAEKFENEYRGNGVKTFYANKESAKSAIALEMKQTLEVKLIDLWRNGEFSMHNVRQIAEALGVWVLAKINEANEKIAKITEEIPGEEAKLSANNKQYSDIGVLSRTMGKHKNMLIGHTEVLTQLYKLRTNLAGWEFAKSLLGAFNLQLSSLQRDIATTVRTLTISIESFENGLKERLQDKGLELNDHVIRFYDRDKVIQRLPDFVLNKNLQHTTASNVRNRLLGILGNTQTFGNFNSKITDVVFQDTLSEASEQNANVWHDTLPKQHQFMGQSIVQKLQEEFAGNDLKLTKFVRDIIRQSGSYLQFNTDEINKKGDGIPDRPNKVVTYTVIIPHAAEEQDFVKKLEEAFRQNISTTGNVSISIVPQNDLRRRHEIVLMTVTNLFPLRFVGQLKYLKEGYDRQVIYHQNAGEKAKNRMILHLEGDGMQHPDLYIKTITRNEYTPYMLTAIAMELFTNLVDARGVSQLALVRKDEDGFDLDPVFLGTDLHQAKENMSMQDLEALRREVEAKLKSEFLQIAKREELKIKIIDTVEAFKESRGGSLTDPVYVAFRDAGKQAVAILKQ